MTGKVEPKKKSEKEGGDHGHDLGHVRKRGQIVLPNLI